MVIDLKKLSLSKNILIIILVYVFIGILFLIVDGYLGYLKIVSLFPKQTLQNIHVPDAKLCWKPRPLERGHHRASGSFDVIYEMDENGYKKIENPKIPSRSLYFFGDSYTFGHGVSNADTSPTILADRYLRDDIAVYNLGVMGYGITQMAVRFLEIESKLRPGDLVIFSPTTQDLTRDVFSFTMPMCLFFSNRVTPFQRFPVFRNGQFEYWPMDNLFNRLRLIAEFAPCTGRFLRLIEPKQIRLQKALENQKMNQEIIETVKEKVEKKGAHFCLFFLPEQEELSLQNYSADVSYLTPLEIMPFFHQEAISQMFFPEGHWNPLGHQMAAEAILRLLLINHLITFEELKPDAIATFPQAGK